jgi:hypothetical protein
MRQSVFLFLLALMLMHLDLSAADPKADRSIKKESRVISFKDVPVPDEIKSKLVDKAMAGDGGNEYFCLFPPNDRNAALGNMSLYVCSGNKPNTTVRIYKGENKEPLITRTITEPFQVIALCAGTGVKGGIPIADLER